ncbi:glycosyltransferase family 2 protein [Aliarcobacter butzleri]|uniref:glycosyltransferase family 2 protein n=1 Tax=Aliarcobacter butzleri TaxID=28197 RepID=UPI003AFA97D4
MSNKEVFISIIVPVYNAEEYLDECLQSILKQTIIENIELICVNDGSSVSLFGNFKSL